MIVKIVERSSGTILEAIVRPNVTREELTSIQLRWRSYKEASLLLQSGGKALIPEHNAWDWPKNLFKN